MDSAFLNKRLIDNSQLFRENTYVRRSVNIIANAVSSMKFKVYFKNELKVGSRLEDILNRPNDMDTWSSFIEGLVTNYIVFGNAYVVLIKNDNAFQLHILESDCVKVIPGKNGSVDAFEYTVNGTKFVYKNNGSLPCVGHLKNYNPYNKWYGMSFLDSVQASASLHQAITTHNLSYIQNGCRPAGVVTIKDKSGVPISQDEAQKISSAILDEHKGPYNAGKIGFIQTDGDFEWKQMGTSPKDMDFISSKSLAGREICEALGVPSVLLGGIGLQGESTRSNLKEVINFFNESTVLPIAEKIFAFLNNWFVPVIGSNYKIAIDMDNFLPMHSKRFEMWDKVNSATFLSNVQKRKILGLEEFVEEDEEGGK